MIDNPASGVLRRGDPTVVPQPGGPPTGPAHCLIESAIGVERAYTIASAGPSVAGIGLGEADLRSELGVAGEAGLG